VDGDALRVGGSHAEDDACAAVEVRGAAEKCLQISLATS